MVKVAPGHTLPDSTRRPLRSAGFYVTRWRGQIVIRRNPRFRKNQASPLQQQQRDEMALLAKALANVSPTDRAYAEALARGTQLTWRDVMSLTMMGRWTTAPGAIAPMAYPDLDMIGTIPGALLAREDGSWLLLEPGSQGQVLTMLSGKPRWQNPPAAPGGGGVNFSADFLDALAITADTPAFTTSGMDIYLSDAIDVQIGDCFSAQAVVTGYATTGTTQDADFCILNGNTSSAKGFYFACQGDGNVVFYYYDNGSFTVLRTAETGTNDTAPGNGTILHAVDFSFGETPSAGIPNWCRAIWRSTAIAAKAKQIDFSSGMYVGCAAASFADIKKVQLLRW